MLDLQISVMTRLNPLIPVATSIVDDQLNKIANEGAAASTHDRFHAAMGHISEKRG